MTTTGELRWRRLAAMAAGAAACMALAAAPALAEEAAGASAEAERTSGFVESFQILSALDDTVYFAGFPDGYDGTEVPEVTLPYPGTLLDAYYQMPLTLSEAGVEHMDELRYTLTLTDSGGEKAVEDYTWSFYGNATINVGDANKTYYIGRMGILENWFRYLEPGEYTLGIHVYRDGHEDSGDVYSLKITLAPALNALDASTGMLNWVRDPTGISEEAASELSDSRVLTDSLVHGREQTFIVAGDTESVTLQGGIYNWIRHHYDQYLASVYLDGADITEEFLGEGHEVDLRGLETVDGRYELALSVVYDPDGTGPDTSVRTDYAVYVEPVEGTTSWTISEQPSPASRTVEKGAEVVYSVAVSDPGAQVSYQWQSGTNQSFFGSLTTDIEGGTSTSYSPPTEVGGSLGTKYYRCVVTDEATGATAYSDAVRLDVELGDVNAPEIIVQPGTYNLDGLKADYDSPYRTEYLEGEAIDPIPTLVYNAEGTGMSRKDPVALDLQWYINTSHSYEGATALDEENSVRGTFGNEKSSYRYDLDEDLSPGTYYVWFVATATAVDDPTNTASTESEPAVITISARGQIEGFEGAGTEDDPYLVEDADQLWTVHDLVEGGDELSGAVFRLACDVELPEGWDPIGSWSPTGGYNPFGGVIDGAGHTLTVPAGGKPLLNYCRDAVVRDLCIYGEEIDGAGLLDSAGVDYGEDGVYQATDPDIITVENVTLKSGSKTSGSGLVNGGYTSGINDIVIRGCTVEEGVVVGYGGGRSSIGSFVGTLNGRIEDSVSSATVYGTSRVGGLAGVKGQSMGDCTVVNSAFLGEVVATGSCVGGILGSGYVAASAPNTPPVSIQNCYAAADITGSTAGYVVSGECFGYGVGGILGTEYGLKNAWNEAWIADNHFYGTITDTNEEDPYHAAGGIVGDLGSYDPELQDYSNNYYLESDSYRGLGEMDVESEDWDSEASFTAKNAEDFSDGTVTALLNQGDYGNWVDGEDGYPVHSDAAYVRELVVGGEYKTEYYVGDDLDLSGMTVTAVWSDGTEEVLALADVEVSGFDSSERAYLTVTVSYGAARAEIEVVVLDPPGDDITVQFELLGDDAHGDESGEAHTLAGQNLVTWVERESFTVSNNATVLDLIELAADEFGFEIVNEEGNYISEVIFEGVELAEFTNGANSGWMYTLNGWHSDLGVAEQFLSDGDVVIFHYTDDYEQESWDMSEGGANAKPSDVVALIDAIGEVTAGSGEAIEAARAAYDSLTADQLEFVTNYDVLLAAEEAYAAITGGSGEGDPDDGTGVPSVEGVAGDDRYATMAALGTEFFADGSVDTVVVASGQTWPDALAASALAGLHGSPLVLTGPDALGDEAASEIERLGATSAIVVGGTDTLSGGVASGLSSLGLSVERIAGEDRVETAQRIYESYSGWSGDVVLASSATYADSLSAGPYAYATATPVVLAEDDGTVPAYLAEAIAGGEVDRAVIVGGTDSVPASAEDGLESLLGSDGVIRLAGDDRYQTSSAIADWATGTDSTYAFEPLATLSYDRSAVASGSAFPDALSAAAACGSAGSVLLLADGTDAGLYCIDANLASADGVTDVYVVGGTDTLGEAVVQAVREAISG